MSPSITNNFKGVLICASLFFFIQCKQTNTPKSTPIGELVRVGGVVINDNIDQIEFIMEGIQVNDETRQAYGIDFKAQRAYTFSLVTGDLRYLGGIGRGPNELSLPGQVSLSDDGTVYIYDISQDVIAIFERDSIVRKVTGYLAHEIWLRNPSGAYWNRHLVTAMEEPEYIVSNNLPASKPLGFLNLDNQTLSKRGRVSPTLDQLDNVMKHPVITIDSRHGHIYYVYLTDHTVMRYDIANDTTIVFASQKHANMRQRTIKTSLTAPQTRATAKVIGLDFSKVVGLDVMDQKLVVVWQNLTEAFYETASSDKHIDFFGIQYDLSDPIRFVEFTLPGRYLGKYGNALMILENVDPLAYSIGFYQFK